MTPTTLANINARISGTGVVLKAADVSAEIPAAKRWLIKLYADAGKTEPTAATYEDDLTIDAQTLRVLSRIAFAGFSFGKADAAGRFDFSDARRFRLELAQTLGDLGLRAAGSVVKTIERGVDYGTTPTIPDNTEFYI